MNKQISLMIITMIVFPNDPHWLQMAVLLEKTKWVRHHPSTTQSDVIFIIPRSAEGVGIYPKRFTCTFWLTFKKLHNKIVRNFGNLLRSNLNRQAFKEIAANHRIRCLQFNSGGILSISRLLYFTFPFKRSFRAIVVYVDRGIGFVIFCVNINVQLDRVWVDQSYIWQE